MVIWLWKLKISIFVCLFVYLFVCTLRFANFAKGKWSNHDSKNCSEIRTVTWSVIWLWKLQFTILIFFSLRSSNHSFTCIHITHASSFKIQMKTHTELRPFNCDQRIKTFMRKSYHKKHSYRTRVRSYWLRLSLTNRLSH